MAALRHTNTKYVMGKRVVQIHPRPAQNIISGIYYQKNIYLLSMKLYSWNVNGIRAVWNKGLFQKFIAEHDPDILCLQETKAMPEQSPVDLPQYHEYYHSAERKGHFGTAIFSKQKPLEVRNGFSNAVLKSFTFPDQFGDPSKEGRVISARFDDFWVVTVYTPNSKDKLERIPLRHNVWDPAFLMHVQELEQDAPVLFSGDFNVAHTEIDLARPKENVGKHGYTAEEREGFEKMLSTGYIDTLRSRNPGVKDLYTWWTAWGGARARNVGWRIDYWMASPKLNSRIKEAKIHPEVMGSDHCPVSITID
jgi:exodeoxyribonuclease III